MQIKVLINGIALLLDLLKNSEGTKLLIWKIIFGLVFTAPAKWRVELRTKISQYRNRCFTKPLKWKKWTVHLSHIYQIYNENSFLVISAYFWLTYPFSSIDKLSNMKTGCIRAYYVQLLKSHVGISDVLEYMFTLGTCVKRSRKGKMDFNKGDTGECKN